MLFLFYFMEVVQMKYEMPTCEIVLLEQCVVTTSGGTADYNRVETIESPVIPLV